MKITGNDEKEFKLIGWVNILAAVIMGILLFLGIVL
jgi:hypothetical protein